MSHGFFISAAPSVMQQEGGFPQWKITAEELSTLFHRDWVVSKESVPCPHSEGLGNWTIQFGVYSVYCFLGKDGFTLYPDGDIVRCLLIAFWYRQFMPPEIELWLWSGDGEPIVEITKPFDELKIFFDLFEWQQPFKNS